MDYRIEEILAEIENNLSQPLSIKNLATSENVSVSYLQHLFKQETTLTITEHIKDLRLRKACEFLETTNLSVKEIRKLIWLTDAAHFARDFKKKYGLTPTQYRRKMRK